MRKCMLMTAVLCMTAMLTGCGGQSDIYQTGTYTATVRGYGGDITVEVAFDKDTISAVNVTEHNETAGIGDQAIEQLCKEIVEEQTYEVDAVSSATVTSDAIKNGVRDCMEQAAK